MLYKAWRNSCHPISMDGKATCATLLVVMYCKGMLYICASIILAGSGVGKAEPCTNTCGLVLRIEITDVADRRS